MKSEFRRILFQIGFSGEKADTLAQIFMENSLDGVYTHGVNRFSRFVSYFRNGWIKSDAEPTLIKNCGAIEQWDGGSGPGPLNALRCSDRAMELARINGIGSVALSNTNHWMRGGTYGWRAAKSGFALISWTNTTAHMPPWGSSVPKLGNNPLVLAVPYRDEAIVLDMAMSQYSFGALELQKLKQQRLAVNGGFDINGELTDDPAAIIQSNRVLPIGYWKGAGLSLLLDILATILSGGLSVKQISERKSETNVSQVFIAIDIKLLQNFRSIASAIQEIIDDYHTVSDGSHVIFPGEKVLATRKENSKKGIPVLKIIWEEIQALA